MNSATKRPNGGQCRKVRLKRAVVLLRLVQGEMLKDENVFFVVLLRLVQGEMLKDENVFFV